MSSAPSHIEEKRETIEMKITKEIPKVKVTMIDCSTNLPLYGCSSIEMQVVPCHAEYVSVSAMSGDKLVKHWIVARVVWVIEEEVRVNLFLVPDLSSWHKEPETAV